MRKVGAIANEEGRKYHYAPNEHVVFKVSAGERAQIDLAENEIGYLGGPPLHVHSAQDEIHYVLEGKLRYQIGEEIVEVESGGCVYLPKAIPHAWVNLQKEAARVIVILTPGGSEGFFASLASSTIAPSFETLLKLGRQYGSEIVGPPLAVSLGLVN
jgi:mannose-6-phosphate isomerase-like protein (cupin superfamily)